MGAPDQDRTSEPARRRTGEDSRPEGGRPERSGQVQSLLRALTLLNHLSEVDDGASLTELAHRAGLAPSTAHRLLTTLQQAHYVRFDTERTRWSIGVQAFVVGNTFVRNRDLPQFARPIMRHLMEESGETVNLAVEDQGQAVYLAQVESRQMMRALVPPGARALLHASGVGKALLSAMSEARRAEALKRHGLPRVTVRTRTSLAALTADLEEARRKGVAVDDEEHAVGLRCVASVIYDETGAAAGAISVSGPAARITADRLPALADLVLKAAQRITLDFGGSHPGRTPRPGRSAVRSKG